MQRAPSTTMVAGHGGQAHVTAADRWVLGLVQRHLAEVPVAFALWDGRVVRHTRAEPVATVVIRDRRTLLGLCWDPDMWFGEGYATGSLEVRGDLVALLVEVYRKARPNPAAQRLAAMGALRRAGRTSARSRDNVHHHYDLGNAFYRLWLDREMLYTCAYFADESMSLEQAQVAKMDLVCRKLRLAPGDRVVEAGCGWGSLALHMARRYGVTVKAYNLSREQILYARERARAERLDDRVTFIEDDYRAVAGEFDVFVSVGMLEHVGAAQLRALGQLIDRTLAKPNGRGFLHFIGRTYPMPLNPWIERRVFPGAYPPALAEVVGLVLAPHDFAVVDVENLRAHYARTLAEWLRRFEAAAPDVERMYDPSFVRLWRLYLAGSEASFQVGWMQLFQVVFARGWSDPAGWTRRRDLVSPSAD